MSETYIDIPGYEGLYQVSNYGNVKSVSHFTRNNANGGVRFAKGRKLATYKMPNGYLQVQLSNGNKREKKYVHRLVAIAFLENKNNYTDVNHIDGDKNNNNVSNLEWCSHKKNQIHMFKNGLTKGARVVMCLDTRKTYYSISEAVRKTGVSKYYIRKSCEEHNNNKDTGWMYISTTSTKSKVK